MDGKDRGKTSLVRNVNIYKYERGDVKVKYPFHSGKNYVMEFFLPRKRHIENAGA